MSGATMLRALSAVRVELASWGGRLRAAGTLRPILSALRRRQPSGARWVVRRHLRTLNDVLVSSLAPVGRPALALLKRPTTDAGERALRRQQVILLELRRQPGLDGWTRMVPKVLASGRAGGRPFLVETMVPGVAASELLRNGCDRRALMSAAQAAIEPLHRGTGMDWRVDEQMLGTLIDEPLERLRPAVIGRSRLAGGETALESLRAELRAALSGRIVRTGWVHGDLCPGNVLVAADGGGPAGLVDWEQSRPWGLPELDRLQLLLTTRMEVRRQELGEVVTELLRHESWEEAERPLVAGIASNGSAPGVPARTWLLLAWLHHVAGNVAKSERYARSGLWVRRNVTPVLAAALAGPASVGGERVGPTARLRAPDARWRPRIPAALAARRLAIAALPHELAAPLGMLSLGLALWLASLGRIDARAMTDTGLVSVLPVAFVAALGVLTASFAVTAYRHPGRQWLLTGHLVSLVAVLHATPSIVYGTLRYSWAWKHVGVVDYIQRHGAVKTDIGTLDVYHNWPGFFGLDALFTELAGLPDAIGPAIWGPVFFNLLDLAALVFLFTSLTHDRRTVWLGCWVFLVASWVGQDYFSPQAFAFFLYLVMMGIVVRWLAPPAPLRPPRWAVATCLLLMTAIAVSHPLTAVMATLALATLTVCGVCAVRSLPLLAGAIAAVWDVTLAADFTRPHAEATLDSVGLPWNTTQSSLTKVGHLSDGQALVATLGRGLVVVVVALAAVGTVRMVREGKLNRAAVVLAVSPIFLFASGDYDGEILFRIYLFALPCLAFLAARAFATKERVTWRGAPAFAVAAVILTGLFLFAYYGKERQYYFTPREVAAATWLYSNAPPQTLLVEGTRNYPGQFKRYERFEYVPLSLEPAASSRGFLSDPVGVFSSWMGERSHRGAFLIITRSQKAEVDELGAMPPHSLDRIERSLLRSPRFRVAYRNRDAMVFTLAGARR